MKRIYVIEDLCAGCEICEVICSFVNTKEFNPRKARVKVVKIEE